MLDMCCDIFEMQLLSVVANPLCRRIVVSDKTMRVETHTNVEHYSF